MSEYVCMHACMRGWMYVCMYVCTYVYIYIYIYMRVCAFVNVVKCSECAVQYCVVLCRVV